MKLIPVMKLAAVAALATFCSFNANAQGGYVKLGAAYNFGNGGDIEYNTTSTYVGTNNGGSRTEKYERVNVNLGKGISAGGTLGYMFNQHVGAELGIAYLLGGKNEITSTHTETNPNFNRNSSTKTETYSRMLLLQPSVIISAGMEGLNPYARFGLVAANGKVYLNNEQTGSDGEFIYESEYSGNWGLGLQGGLGIDFGLSENLGFFTEVTMSNLKYSPDKMEIVTLTHNGIDRLGALSTNEKEYEFLDEFEATYPGNSSDSEPSKEHKFNMPFGSVGVGIGIKYNF